MQQLYRKYILDHYHNPHNRGTLENPDISYELENPVCGDVVRLDVRLEDGRVGEARFSGEGCVLSMAAASMFTDEVVGKTVQELRVLQEEDILQMLGVKPGAARANCVLLALRALQGGLARLEEG